MQTYEPVQNSVALLIGSELWGFVTPSTVDLNLVREATAKIQPPYAVPSKFLALGELPLTRNGKIDKRELHSLADAEKTRREDSFLLPVSGLTMGNKPSLSSQLSPLISHLPPTAAMAPTSAGEIPISNVTMDGLQLTLSMGDALKMIPVDSLA